MKIGLIVAMEKELAAVNSSLGGSTSWAGKQICAMQSGIGKVNAALTALKLIRDFHPDCIINSGCAGGLSPRVSVMDVAVGAETAYHDVWCGPPNEVGQMQGLPARFTADKSLLAAAESMDLAGKHVGLLVSGDRFCSSKEETDGILANFPEAIAVDMESAAIAQACYLEGVPFLSFRVISDSAYAGDNRLDAYYDFWGSITETSFETLKHLIEIV